MHKKSRLIAAVISNCKTHSKRERYIYCLLQHHMRLDNGSNVPLVHFYGNCSEAAYRRAGVLTKISEQRIEWRAEMTRDTYWYGILFVALEQGLSSRFYASFENSICPYYVTEKVFSANRFAVPLVLSDHTHRG